jgi:phosphohistidine swiveling domain-containing protein
MQTLKSYIDIDEDHAPDKVFAAGEVAAEAAIQRLGKEIGRPKLVSYLARRTRAIAGVRELPKFTIIRLMGIVRAKMIKEGEILVQLNILQDPRDIFLLHDEEILAVSKGEERNWKNLIKERQAIMADEANRHRVPRVLTSEGFGFYGGAVTKANAVEGKNILCGEPVSPGTYEGRVRIVHNPTESQLRPGEILVCHGTDPSWTPLFLSAGALLMEVGGLMTHGSVVAREYGIPAIVGMEKITERLTTGQLVRIDGSSGVVEIIEDVVNLSEEAKQKKSLKIK